MAKIARSDPTKESGGVWVDHEDGYRLKIARMSNPEYEREINAALLPFRKAQRGQEAVDDDKIEELTRRAMSMHILVGWEDVDDDDGKPLVYSPEASLKLLSDPERRDFYRFVLLTSNRFDLYRRKLLEDSAKN